MERLKPPAKRQAWLLAALPASARTVRVIGDRDLSDAVTACGYEVVTNSTPADALLVERRGLTSPTPPIPAGLTPTAIAIDAASVPRRRPAWRRAFDLATSPLRFAVAGLRARGAVRSMGALGPVETVMMSDRSRTVYALGENLWGRRMPPVAAIVRSTERPSILEHAVAEASTAVGKPLEVDSVTVRETGKLVADLSDRGGGAYVMRLAFDRAAGYVEQAIDALAALSAPGAPAAVRERVPEPILDGRVAGARFQLERRVEGTHPERLTPALWAQSVEFLAELHNFQQEARVSSAETERVLSPPVELLAAVAGEPAGGELRRLAESLMVSLSGISLGWAHGDCWRENLFVEGERLRWVIDWDAASPRALPLHDLWDLLTMSRRRDPAWGAGMRFTAVLWPLLEAGEPQTSAYCRATGVGEDRATLGALAVAYWLMRTAREIEEAPQRLSHRGWIERNLREPLTTAAGMGLTAPGPERSGSG